MDDADLLRSLDVDPAQLDPAPPPAERRAAGAERLKGSHPCARCGKPARATGVVDTPGHGRRWLDRCMPCLIVTTPRGGPRAPLTAMLAMLREAAQEAGVDLSIVTDEPYPAAMDRYHLTLTADGRPVMHGWWADLATAERKYTRWIGERGSREGARITLTDEADGGQLLKAWPDESH
ncbi:hypothetical protein [Streptomyces sp. NPDC057557]|uniref:hypothetical protein n=1 Tax=Streptomyces sp. NPDC057557 TaxID=3346167 RepID=UPI0036B2F652